MKSKRFITIHAVILLAAIVTTVCILFRHGGEPVSRTGQNAEIRVDFIDVGKGDCILIRSGTHTVLIDTGYKDTAGKVCAFLDSEDVSEINTLLITHYDKDHIGGAEKLLSEYPVETIYLPDYDKDSKPFRKLMKAIQQKDSRVTRVSEETTFTAGHVTCSVMPSGVAYDAQKENDNDLSLLVTVVNGKDSFFFAGDIEKTGIRSFLDKNHRTCDVIKIPHHGRIESNSKALQDSVKPSCAVITDDDENSADSELCRLLESAGIEYYRTGEKGTVTVTGNGSGHYTIRTEKGQPS